MMYAFRILVLTVFAPLTMAVEHNNPKNAVYSEQSQLTVDNINKAVDVIRDPTQMSMNFKQALKNIAPTQATTVLPETTSSASVQTLPKIELVGKVLCRRKAGTAVIRVDDRPFHVAQGRRLSMFHDGALWTIRVDEVTANHVKLFLVERNEVLILQ